jgi:hypothetical protein
MTDISREACEITAKEIERNAPLLLNAPPQKGKEMRAAAMIRALRDALDAGEQKAKALDSENITFKKLIELAQQYSAIDKARIASQDEQIRLMKIRIEKSEKLGATLARHADGQSAYFSNAKAARERMREALKKAEGFIVNGTELGFIRMPDKDVPDSAHDTLPMIRAAIEEK